MLNRPVVVLLTTLLAVLAGAVPAAAAVPAGPAGDAFYKPPKKLPGRTHGDAIWVRRLTNEQTLSQARTNQLILYRSTSVGGKAIAVSGTIHLPKGKAPKGGWPVVSWAHATSGIGDQCAPSRNPGEGAIHAYHVYIEGLLDRWLQAGFAIVRTDYEGLGTKGVHPYLVGVSEARGVLDIVRAARQYNRGVGSRVAVAGHSQGGHAAVFAAALAPKWTPELGVRGTAAFAPFAQGDEIFGALAGSDQPSRLSGYAALLARGIDAARPALGVPSLLSARGRELYPLTLSRCITEITSEDSEFAQTAPRDLFASGADLSGLAKEIARNDPTGLRLTTPLLVEQGSADTTVFPAFTEAMVEGLRKRGGKVTYKRHENIDHTTVVFGEPQDEAFSWVSKRLR
ncbi:MAG TPA: alpha/beta fold hydrolase [Thermoleophilaceae bacterium]|nr:alpha/beta fold hydrolase [Thermoleophilaceae bacterium]